MKKILIIDDNEEIRQNISEILISEGFAVLEASNGHKGIVIAKEEIPDLILCDITMPGLSGYEVLSNIKENSVTRNIPFIFLSGKADIVSKQTARNLGAVDYVIKPFELTDLLSVVSSRIRENESYKNQSRSELLEYVSQLEQMLIMTSHRVRRPVCSCLGLVEIIQFKNLKTMSDEEVGAIIEHFKTNSLELDTFTKELTNFLCEMKERYAHRMGEQK